MQRLVVVIAAAVILSGCAATAQQSAGRPSQTASPEQSPSQTASPEPSPSAIVSPIPAASPSLSPSPVASPTGAAGPLLVFVKPGSVALVRPDGTVLTSTETTMDSGEVATGEYQLSTAALIGHYWGQDGNPTSPLAIAVLDRTGTISPLAPAAAKVLTEQWAQIVLGHEALLVRATEEKADYLRLDLTTGALTVLLTVTGLPPVGFNDGPPLAVQMTTLGTNADGSVVRVMVTHVKVGARSIDGPAYLEIDLNSNRVKGPWSLPNVGPLAMSGDGRFIGWTEWAPVSGSQRDLHVRDLTSGREWTVPKVPYQNESDHAGVQFSPDDGYVLLEGYGSDSMGFAVYDMATHRMVGSAPAPEPDEPLANVPLWWTDSHTLVYQTVDASGTASGHRFDVGTGAITDYPAELGAPVLMLG